MTTKRKPKAPPRRRGEKSIDMSPQQATADEFERKGMGVAAKE